MLEKTLESPLDTRRPSQSIRKEINPEYSLEGQMLKLKLQYFGYLMWRADSLEETLMLGKIEGRRRRRWQRMRCLDGIPDSMDMNLSKLQEMVKNREAWHAVVHGVTKSGMTERLNSDTTKAVRKGSSLSLFLMRGFFVVVFWLPWVLVTVLSLSLFVMRGGQLFRGTLASHCSGFSLQSTGSRLCMLQ